MTIKFYSICIFLCAAFSTDAQQNDLAEADTLFRQGKYFESSVSYERVLFGNYDLNTEYRAITGKLSCLKKQQQFAKAVTFIAQNMHNDLPDTIKTGLLYEQTLCSYLTAYFENTISLVDQISNNYPAYDNLAFLHMLKILSLNELQRWNEAKAEYQEWLKNFTNIDTIVNPYISLPKLKNENTAQWLSTFIPGAGQIYAGKPFEGLVTILLQGGAIYFGIITWQQKYYISAWLGGVGLFGSFHNGGVRRSEVLVKQYNRKKVIEFNGKVKEELIAIINRQ
jgi:TM2 domain-containing membrane protein YozV/cytochrome c-type biogenesis protein CcmH/NrfF